MTGQQTKSICKEELTKSKTEIELKKRIEAKAPLMQKRHSSPEGGSTSTKSSSKEKRHSSAPGGSTSSKTSSKQPQKQAKTVSSEPVLELDLGSKQVPPTGEKERTRLKKIRISVSDRQQVTVTLDASITYDELQQLILQKFDIPAEKQRIKYGFPPKLLTPPPDGSKEQPLNIQHGDKLSVEILDDEKPGSNLVEPEAVWPAEETHHISWSTFDANTHDQSAQNLLEGLDQLQAGSQDSLDTVVSSISLMASLSGKDIWHYVQNMPHLFSVGGLFYRQVQRDIGLTDGKHCTLPSLPGKTFRYNAKDDRLELCLEPYGHYPIEPDIENTVLKKRLADGHTQSTSTKTDAQSAGCSGVVINKSLTEHSPKGRTFPGQGHRLLSSSKNIRMPHDLAMNPSGHGSMDTANQVKASIIEEEDNSMVNMEAEKTTEMDDKPKEEPEFKRLGPGVTVLSSEVSNVVNKQREVFRMLASQIETITQDARADGEPGINEIADMATDSTSVSSKPSQDEAILEPMDST